MCVYQIFRNGQCLNDLRVLIYDLGTLTTWLYTSAKQRQEDQTVRPMHEVGLYYFRDNTKRTRPTEI